jgi:hypothetical protein
MQNPMSTLLATLVTGRTGPVPCYIADLHVAEAKAILRDLKATGCALYAHVTHRGVLSLLSTQPFPGCALRGNGEETFAELLEMQGRLFMRAGHTTWPKCLDRVASTAAAGRQGSPAGLWIQARATFPKGSAILARANASAGRPVDILAYTGKAMNLDGHRHPVAIDLAGMSFAAGMLLCDNHDVEIGKLAVVRVAGDKLMASGFLDVEGSGEARAWARLADKGRKIAASIGANPVGEMDFVRRGKRVQVNGNSLEGPLYVARRSTLREISLVTRGADSGAVAKVA